MVDRSESLMRDVASTDLQQPEYAVANEFWPTWLRRRGADPAVLAEVRSKTVLALGRLRPGLRLAATLAVIEERPHKEVAKAFGISVKAVKLRVFRALRLLRKDLQKPGKSLHEEQRTRIGELGTTAAAGTAAS